jgi:transposase
MAESRPRRRRRTSSPVLERINPNAAGIDCGATTHVVAVPPDRDDEPVQSFRTFTTGLQRLADWLVACRVTSVALESTGVFWIPVYEILEARVSQETGEVLGDSFLGVAKGRAIDHE